MLANCSLKRGNKMNNKRNIIYVMQYIDNNKIVKHIPYKKIGITANLSKRLQQINNTNSPLEVECVIAWLHDKAREIEKKLHCDFDNIRYKSSKSEWFNDENNNLIDEIKPIMENLGAKKLDVKSYLEEEAEHMKCLLEKKYKVLLDQIIYCLPPSLHNLETSIKSQDGPRISGDQSKLTFYVHYRKYEAHNLAIGRIVSKENNLFDQLKSFLKKKEFKCKMSGDEAMVYRLSAQKISNIINSAESEFKAYLAGAAKGKNTPSKQ